MQDTIKSRIDQEGNFKKCITGLKNSPKSELKQECIPVGCVPAAHWLYAGICFPGGGLSGPRGGVSGPRGGVSGPRGVWTGGVGGSAPRGSAWGGLVTG